MDAVPFPPLTCPWLDARMNWQGAELIVFISVNDVFVMRAWEEAQGAKGKVLMLSDGNGDLTAQVTQVTRLI